MGLPSLGVAFSQPRYSLRKDFYHQEYNQMNRYEKYIEGWINKQIDN